MCRLLSPQGHVGLAEMQNLIFTKLLLYDSLVVHSCIAYPIIINVILTGCSISVIIDPICLFLKIIYLLYILSVSF